MANNGEKINISTDDVMNVITILDGTLNIIEGSMLASLSTDFDVLVSLDLFSEGLAKLKSQIEALKQSNENLMTKITLHADEISELEESIAKQIQQEIIGAAAASGGSGSYYSSIESVEVSDVNNNVSISNSNVSESINSITDVEVESIMSFLNINKGEYSINDILLSDVGSGILLCLLKKYYGDTTINIDTEISEESFNIQKLFLEKVLNNESIVDNIKFNDNVIFIAKKYFVSIAKNNNISISELILDEKYENLLLNSINKLYLGENLSEYDISDNTISMVREFVDKVAEDNGVTTEKVLSSVDYLGDLKGA